jgi:hypothetical protein
MSPSSTIRSGLVARTRASAALATLTRLGLSESKPMSASVPNVQSPDPEGSRPSSETSGSGAGGAGVVAGSGAGTCASIAPITNVPACCWVTVGLIPWKVSNEIG